MTTTMLGPLPSGDVGFYGVDWSLQLGAVAGDALVGTPTIVCELTDLVISNPQLLGTTQTFNAMSDKIAIYELVARASFAPSGRTVSQRISLIVGEPPAMEPISLEEARQHLRLDTSGNPPAHPDDALVMSMITAARQYVEGATGFTLVTTECTDYRDAWESGHSGASMTVTPNILHLDMRDVLRRPSFLLMRAPVISVNSVRYMDTDGVWQTLAPDEYRVTTDGIRTRLEPAYNDWWPSVYYGGRGVIEIEYTGGFTGPIEEGLRTAIKILVGVYYENRGVLDKTGMEAAGLADILDGYRVY